MANGWLHDIRKRDLRPVWLSKDTRPLSEDPPVVTQAEREEARRLDVPTTLLPFQPYERLSEVLGSGDVLVVLLEQEAGAFSVPSKTLSYLCAGRPVLGLMPGENLASSLVTQAGGLVLPPTDGSLAEAAAWINGVLTDDDARDELGQASRRLAEREFALAGCATRFEHLLAEQAGIRTTVEPVLKNFR